MTLKSTIFIIGGGETVAHYDVSRLRDFGYVIGVNDSAVYAPVDIAISMDRLWSEYRYELFASRSVPMLLRKAACKNLHSTAHATFECNHESHLMTTHPGSLNGTSSGMCAINYAYRCKPLRVFLLGFDMQRGPNDEPYWYPPYPWATNGATKPGKYREWAQQFADIAGQFARAGIDVFNVTHRSALEAFPKITFETMLEMVA